MPNLRQPNQLPNQLPNQDKIPSTLVECILAYAAVGYATFPTCESKRPMAGVKWKESRVDTIPSPRQYPAGQFGVRLKTDDLVVDIDPRNMRGRKVWTELKQLIPDLQDAEEQATVVQTGGGGFHLYLRKPADFQTKKHIPEFPGLDFLSSGAYVIGAGSVVHEKPYKFITPPFASVQAPIELLNMLQNTVIDMGAFTQVHYSNTPENIKLFIQYLLHDAPIAMQGKNGDQTTYGVACRAREFSLSYQTSLELMLEHYNPKCVPPWSPVELSQKVRNAYSYAKNTLQQKDPISIFKAVDLSNVKETWWSEVEKTKKGFKTTLRNCVLFLTNEIGVKGLFIYNEFNERLEIRGHVPWENRRKNKYNAIDDREIECIRLHLAEKFKVDFSTSTVWKAVDLVAAGNSYHPIKELIETYRWDGVARIDHWLSTYCGCADTELNQQIGRKVLCAMAARIYDPGCKFDYVLVLEGAQGIGKSTCCEIIGGDWYGDSPIDPKDKDCIPYIHSKWVIELSEMVTYRKTESDRLKSFITRREDDVRLPYARVRQRFPRQCIFIGTINPDTVGYLTDVTGNRRFWPVFCNGFDLAALRRDRDQLIAEAIVCYKRGEPLMLSDALVRASEDEVQKRLAQDPWSWVIQEWVYSNLDMDEVTTQYIYRYVLDGNIQTMNTGDQRRIATALQNLGWSKHNTIKGMVYRRVKKIEKEIKLKEEENELEN